MPRRPKQPGIYLIRCWLTGRCYVGQSVDIPTRWMQHKDDLCDRTHHSRLMQRDWNWAWWAFRFTVLERSAHNLDALETKWIVRKNAAYNTCWPGGRDYIQRINGRIIPRHGTATDWSWAELPALAIGSLLGCLWLATMR